MSSLLTGVVVAVLCTVGVVAIAAPASAAVVEVSTPTELQDALDASSDITTIVTLTAPIDAGGNLGVSQSVTLDLGGQTLDTTSLRLAPGVTLVVQDTLGGGTLTADASASISQAGIHANAASLIVAGATVEALGGESGAAIGGDRLEDGGSISITSGHVTVSAGAYGAGIGGGGESQPGAGDGGGSGTISISGGTVSADASNSGAAAIGDGQGSWLTAATDSVTISGGTVDATAGNAGQGAAIGGSLLGNPGPILITGGVVTASGGSVSAVIGGGMYSEEGSVTIGGTADVTATNSGGSGAAIGSGWYGSGQSVSITGGTVEATSAVWAAAIGSGLNSAPADISISGGSVIARGNFGAAIGGAVWGAAGTISVTGGSVEAHQTGAAPAIGGGGPNGSVGGAGGVITIGAGATATTINDGGPFTQWNSAVGAGNFGAAGTITVAGTLNVSTESVLRLATGASATVEAGGVITGVGAVEGGGTIVNHGSIQNETVTAVVTDHNYEVSFLTNLAGEVPAALSPVRVYATSFVDGSRSIPGYVPSDTDWTFQGWSDTATGAATFVDATTLSGDRTLYAVYAPITVLLDPPQGTTVTAGSTVSFTTRGENADGDDLGDLTSRSVFGYGGTEVFTGNTITFTRAGDFYVGATIGGRTDYALIHVQHAAATWMNLWASSSSVTAGGTLTFHVDGNDAYGNGFDLTNDVVLSSNVGSDALAGTDFTFTSSGAHQITSTLGSMHDSFAVTVAPAAADHFRVSTAPSGSVVAGDSRLITATTLDQYDNVVADVTGDTTFSSSNLSDAQAPSAQFTFTQAGSRVIHAEWNADASFTDDVTVGVVGDALHPASLTITPSSMTVNQYGMLTFAVDGVDAYGNPLTGLAAVLTSTVATDVVAGNSVTFPHASPHVITATLNGVSAAVTIQVVAAALPITGNDISGLLAAALLLLLAGVAFRVRVSAREARTRAPSTALPCTPLGSAGRG